MKSLEKLKKVLSDVEINEEQKSALDEFFAELYENLQEKAREEVQEELEFMNEALDGTGSKEGWIKVEEAEEAFNRGMLDAERAFNALSQEYDVAMEKAEKAFNLLSNDYDLAMENAEKAFDLAMEDAEQAFNLFAEDSEQAFTLVQEDLIKEHSETMGKAMDHLYETLLEKAKEEIYESQDFSMIKQIKDILTPIILEESNSTALMTKVRELEKQLSLAKQEKINSEKDQIIESLVDELPIKEAKIVRNYISEANSIQEVYERYNLAISLLEAKEDREESNEDTINNKKSLKEENSSESVRKPSRNFKDFFEASEEVDEEDDFEEIDELEDEEINEAEFEFQTEETVFSSNSKEKPKTDKFNSFEEAIISSVFKK